jgi:transcriptional regulator with XRE-family HTH domain
MAKRANFGELFKELRIRKGDSLREFCLKNGFDAGNISKLERGRLPPPHAREKLEQYARALSLAEGSDEWYEFFDLAHIGAGRIPPALLNDSEVMARLPLVLRTLQNQQVDGEELERLIDLIRRS